MDRRRLGDRGLHRRPAGARGRRRLDPGVRRAGPARARRGARGSSGTSPTARCGRSIDRWPDVQDPESQIWVRRDAGSPWVIDLPLTPDRDGVWTNKRLPDHVAPGSRRSPGWPTTGSATSSPEIVLIYKARLAPAQGRPRPRPDLAAARPAGPGLAAGDGGAAAPGPRVARPDGLTPGTAGGAGPSADSSRRTCAPRSREDPMNPDCLIPAALGLRRRARPRRLRKPDEPTAVDEAGSPGAATTTPGVELIGHHVDRDRDTRPSPRPGRRPAATAARSLSIDYGRGAPAATRPREEAVVALRSRDRGPDGDRPEVVPATGPRADRASPWSSTRRATRSWPRSR